MIRTRVGYAGGDKEDPRYHDLGDHSEALQIDFDPGRVTYGRLLEIFWGAHNPTRKPWSRQYMHAVFPHGEGQRRQAEDSRRRLESGIKAKVQTEILPLKRFHRAEDYHQKHRLRRHKDFYRQMAGYYPDPDDLTDSTAAARLNGYLGGHGTPEGLAREIDALGLTPASRKRLEALVRGEAG